MTRHWLRLQFLLACLAGAATSGLAGAQGGGTSAAAAAGDLVLSGGGSSAAFLGESEEQRLVANTGRALLKAAVRPEDGGSSGRDGGAEQGPRQQWEQQQSRAALGGAAQASSSSKAAGGGGGAVPLSEEDALRYLLWALAACGWVCCVFGFLYWLYRMHLHTLSRRRVAQAAGPERAPMQLLREPSLPWQAAADGAAPAAGRGRAG